jgi:hypothetical protein
VRDIERKITSYVLEISDQGNQLSVFSSRFSESRRNIRSQGHEKRSHALQPAVQLRD